jgi:NAD+ synthase (glutamine-hydrolysing)/outer membrane lipoprotein carrier protein
MKLKQKLLACLAGLSIFAWALPALAADTLDGLVTFLHDTKTLSADFTQTYPQANEKKTAHGKVFLQKPGKFRWEYNKPYEQLIVGDGQKIWVYEPDLQQVSVKAQDDALGKTPASILSGGINIREDFTVGETRHMAGLEWITLIPKQADATFKKINFGLAESRIKKMALTDQFDAETEFTFDALHINPTLDPGLFVFSAGANVDVIGDR